MDWEWQPGGLAKPLNELLGAVDRQGRLALAEEQKSDVLAILADQLPDQAKLVPLQPVDAWRAVLGPAFDFQGRQLSCEHLTRRVVRYEHDGSVTIIADSYNGKRLNSPNDIV